MRVQSVLLAFFIPALLPAQSAPPSIQQGEVIALAGGANIERTRLDGRLHALLAAAKPDGKIRVRNFGWEGDTVFEQWRDDGNLGMLEERRRAAEQRIQQQAGTNSWRQQRDWPGQLEQENVTLVIAQFGQMESLQGEPRLPDFIAAYERLIGEFSGGGSSPARRVVLVAPVPFEGRMARHNESLAAYTSAIASLAERLNLPFIGPLPADAALTDNGFHLSGHGHRVFAAHIAAAFGISAQPVETARLAALELERLWFDYWRPMNWAFLQGDRATVPYSKDWRDSNRRIFPVEMEDFLPLIQQADENIWRALEGQPPLPIGVRSSIPAEPPGVAPQSPEEELASFKILEGFRVNLFASEADGVVNPIQMRWDERGRLWVACAVSYPQIKPGEIPNDYVLVCEDTNGDGRADRFHKFVEGLFMPSGLELGDGGLYVAQGTELLHFTDTTGDGRADSSRIVLGGFGTADSHQMINCVNWGFGGELWFTQGHHIYSRVETPFGIETLNRAGVWRYRPRTGHLDPFFQWSSAGANCWGVVTTPHGQPFHKSGANIGAYYSTPGLVRSPLAVNAQAMNLCLAPIKQVGMEFLHSSHFPPEMQGRILIGGYYANLLEWHQLDLEDGIYRTTLLPNIIETSNNVFRPVEIRMGPDGAIYVADWYNPIIGHYQASYRHPDRDKEHGRIWRVTWKGAAPVKPAPLADMTIPELLDQLDSPERWAWYQARRLLFEGDTDDVMAALDAWLPAQTGNEERRLNALALSEAHEVHRPELLQSLLASPDARARAYATRSIATWIRTGVLAPEDALALLENQIADPDPIVRLEAVVAASYAPAARAALVAARALDHPFNAYHQHALTKTLHATKPWWGPGILDESLAFERDEHLLFALQNSWVENDPAQLAIQAQNAASDRKQAPQSSNATGASVHSLLRRQIEKHRPAPERRAVWLRALAAGASADDAAFLLALDPPDPALLAALRGAPPANPAPLLEPLFASKDPAVVRQAVRLAGLWRVQTFAETIRLLAFEKNQAHALQALAQLDPDAVVADTLARLPAMEAASAAARLELLVSSTAAHQAFVKALAKPGALPPAAARQTLQTLNGMGKSDAKISPLLMKLAGLNTALPAYTSEFVAKLVKAANTIGDPEEGRKVYEAAGCIACHIPGSPQSRIGPDLSAISRGMPIDMIVTEVIWPALNIKEGYEAATVTLNDGTVITGFKHTETADAVSIRDMANGEIRAIPRSGARSIQTGGTVMPDTASATLDETQLAHLIRYLSTLGQ